MKKIELLSPAGSFEALKAAVNYGADAVYLGGSSFSARAFAKNFDHEEMSEAVKYCHLRGVKVYVTLNTLLTEKELSNALEEARFYYSINVDALIIQDLGLYYLLKKEMPDFDLHASTQMHIHNISGVRNAIRLGYSKVVLARESDLQLIREACREDIEIECFVHGAICVSYSGQCLMSSLSKQRSANKGMCAQCCRLRYELIDTETKEKIRTDTEYLLSPKDMFLLNDIPDLIEAGVSSLKIEGRMKSPSYVGLVTSIYRRAIDAYYEGKRFELGGKEYRDLLTVFNRGFTNSYLHDSQDDIFGNIRPNHMGIKVGRVISCRGKKCLIKLSDELKQFDGIRIIDEKNDEGRILNTLTVNGKYVSSAHKDEIIELKVDAPVKEGSAVVKTLDHELEKTLENYPVRKRPISISLKLKCGLPVRAVCMLGDMRFEKEYGIIPEKAKTSPLTKKDLFDIFSKTNESPFELKDISCDMDDVFIVRSRLNEIRRDLYHSFEEHILASFKRQKRRIPEMNEINISQDRNDIVESHIPLEN
ncbi:MAG: U32 family peptidase, partial [Erysipelotrichaceae bacterium]|nr:U32 family peptidase [Erysipelotrichaceae bacterium]